MKSHFLKCNMIALALCLLPSAAMAATGGIFIEPLISYEPGTTSIEYPSPLANSTGNTQGFGLGARAGFHLSEVLFLGVDARYAMPRFTDSATGYDAAAISMNYGPVIGIQMPTVGLRLWGSYIADGNLNPESNGNLDVKFSQASGYRVGAGFHVESLSLNVEYQQLKYSKANLEALGPFSTNTSFDSVNLKNDAWLASISFPFEM